MGWAILVALVSSGALVLYQLLLAPDLTYMNRYLPLELLGNVALTAVTFSVLNPILEEVLFRGILFQAFAAYWSWHVAVPLRGLTHPAPGSHRLPDPLPASPRRESGQAAF